MRQRQCYLHVKCEKEMNKGKKRDTGQISSWYKRWKCCVTTKEKLFAASPATRCLSFPPPPQAVTDKRLLLSCLRYWTSFLPGWPHIDDTLSIYSEHCEREHITIVHGPRGSRDKSIFCLFSAGSRAHRDSALADISPVTPSNSEPSSAWAGGPSPADFQLRDTSTAR